MNKLIRRFSSFLLRGHHFIDRRLEEKSTVPPRMLKYKTKPGTAKILHFNGNFVIGGTSQLIADIVERTSEKYDHHIVVPSHPKPLPYQPLSIDEYPLAQMPALHKFLEKERPALVHIHYWIRPMHRFYDFGLWYEALFKICEDLELKVIQNINVPTHPYQSPVICHNVFVSHYLQKEFNNSTISSSVIYPGSDMQHFSCPADTIFPSNTIGMVYRLDADKLNKEAIEVFISAVKMKPGLHCYIVGGGYYLDHYKQRVKEEKMADNFTFTGFVSYDSLPGHYKKIGVIVAPVHDESFGQVTPFAMSMGLPVVGYDTGALSEILGSADNLVPYGNIDALAQKAITVLNDPIERKNTGSKNRQRAHSLFTVEKMIRDYETLYDLNLS